MTQAALVECVCMLRTQDFVTRQPRHGLFRAMPCGTSTARCYTSYPRLPVRLLTTPPPPRHAARHHYTASIPVPWSMTDHTTRHTNGNPSAFGTGPASAPVVITPLLGLSGPATAGQGLCQLGSSRHKSRGRCAAGDPLSSASRHDLGASSCLLLAPYPRSALAPDESAGTTRRWVTPQGTQAQPALIQGRSPML